MGRAFIRTETREAQRPPTMVTSKPIILDLNLTRLRLEHLIYNKCREKVTNHTAQQGKIRQA